MTKLYIHSGAFKTGSTSIQQFLSSHADALRSQGVLYAEAGRGRRAQHNNLVAELKGWRAFDDTVGGWDGVFEETRAVGAEAALVSSELLSSLLPDEIRRLGASIADAGFEPVWVHYVREQSSLINALYVERVVAMRPEFADVVERPFEEFPSWSPIALDFLDYYGFAGDILNMIPGVDLRIRPFVRSELDEEDVVVDFCNRIGVTRPDGKTARTNVGSGWRTVELAKRVTGLIAMSPLSQARKDDPAPIADRLRRIARMRARLMAVTTELGWNEVSAIYATEEFRRATRDRYRRSNELLGELIELDIPALFDNEKAKPPNAGHLDDIPATELLTVLEHVFPALVGATDA